MSKFLAPGDEHASFMLSHEQLSLLTADCTSVCLVFDNRRRAFEMPAIASQSNNNKSYFSNETGLLAEEHSRCLQMVTFDVEHISCEPKLSLWALHTVILWPRNRR